MHVNRENLEITQPIEDRRNYIALLIGPSRVGPDLKTGRELLSPAGFCCASSEESSSQLSFGSAAEAADWNLEFPAAQKVL